MSVIYYTENHPKEIRLLFPLAPLISGKNFIESRKRRSLKDFQQREKDGYYIKTSSSGRKPLKIPFTLVTDLLKYDCNTLSDMILCPTIFINGDKDDSVPVPNTKAFYEVLKCPKELYILADCEHTMRTNKNLQDIENIVQKYL
jgi:esterase/lipase